MRFVHWLAAAGLALAAPLAAKDTAATLWRGGTIITMDGDTPATAEAVVEREGRIVFVGPEAAARAAAGKDALLRDLKGATLLPGFVDAHSHFAIGLQTAGGLDLADPATGDTGTVPKLLAAVQRYGAKVPKGGWVVVWRYDDAQLAERRNVSRAELDAILPDRKVVLLHISLHGLIANSEALKAAKLRDGMKPPTGGVMPSDAKGKLTGLLFETAMLPVRSVLPQPTLEMRLAAMDGVQMRYAREGFTWAQDGATNPVDLAFLTSPAAQQKLKIDLALLPFAMTGIDAVLENPAMTPGARFGRVKLQGIKFTLDRSPQARTAFFTRDYALGSPDGVHPWHGQPVTSDAAFQTLARKVHERGWQIFVHANGDAAIDMAIRGFDALGIKAADNRRPIVIHSQFMRPDQLQAYARIGVGPSYFSNHTFYFADTHRRNFPNEVVDFISPFVASRAAGLIASNHSDYPVTPLDTRAQLWSAMARTSRTGVVSGEGQREDAWHALQGLTTGPAWQVFEEDQRGRIKPGLLADFVVLDRNPLTTAVDDIRAIRVLETVKEGQTIWQAGK
ncbi:MAG: amidohydrolase [Sphingomonadaceae bacterium]|nr:amidohydrolase [Sphingomonadaceae bacterium]